MVLVCIKLSSFIPRRATEKVCLVYSRVQSSVYYIYGVGLTQVSRNEIRRYYYSRIEFEYFCVDVKGAVCFPCLQTLLFPPLRVEM